MIKFVIDGRLDGLNEYTKANRGNRYGANNLKKRNQKAVLNAITNEFDNVDISYPIKLKITWYEPNKRRDIDNITFSTKFIQDALVVGGYLVNDSQKYINKLEHDVMIDKDNPRIEVEIYDKNDK